MIGGRCCAPVWSPTVAWVLYSASTVRGCRSPKIRMGFGEPLETIPAEPREHGERHCHVAERWDDSMSVLISIGVGRCWSGAGPDDLGWRTAGVDGWYVKHATGVAGGDGRGSGGSAPRGLPHAGGCS